MKKDAKTEKEVTTELIIILDMSGSMYGLTKDTIGGFNSLIADQKKDSEKVNVTLIVFNHEYHKVFDRIPIKKVPELSGREYHPTGMTSLLDAIGKTITEMPSFPESTKVMMSITTDGQENSSCEYDYKTIKKMVEEKQEEGWEILFVGANMDAVAEAENIGVRANRAVNYRSDKVGTETVFTAMSATVKMFKRPTATMDSAWEQASKVIDDDYHSRG